MKLRWIKIKKLFFSTFLILLFGVSNSWADCYLQADASLETNGVEKMENSCFDQFLLHAPPSRMALGENSEEVVFGHQKYLFAKTYDESKEENIYKQNSGDQTSLEKIHFVEFDRENQMILVIANHNRDILSFRLEHGNIAPDAKIVEPEFGADAVALERSTHQLMILDEQSRSLIFYRRLAHPEGRHEHTTHESLRTLDGAVMGLDRPLDLTSSKQRKEIFIYDQQQGGQVLVYPAQIQTAQAPLRVLDVGHLGPFVRLDFNESEQSLELMNADGEVSVISP